MSFFIHIKGKTLKVGKQVIIGRGSPFENLLPFRDIARAHAKVLEKASGYFIKDLGSETGTFVNGERIKPNVLVQIEPEDQVCLGEHELQILLECEEGQYEVVRRFKEDQSTKKHKMWGVFAIIVILSNITIFLESKTWNHKDFLWSIFFALPVMGVISILEKFIDTKKMNVQEIYFGGEGLTLHYPDKNMSILYDDIDRVWDSNGAIYISAHDQLFRIGKVSGYDKLLRFFKKEYHHIYGRKDLPMQGIIVSLFVISLTTYFFWPHISKHLGLATDAFVATVMCFMVATLFWMGTKKWFQKSIGFYNSKTLKDTQKVGMLFATVAVVYGFIYAFEYKILSNQQQYLRECVQEDLGACDKIDYSWIHQLKKEKYNTLQISSKACDLGSGPACKFIEKNVVRAPASMGEIEYE